MTEKNYSVDMNIVIDEKLNIDITPPSKMLEGCNGKSISVIGNLYGAYYQEKSLSHDEVMNLFCINGDNIEQIINIMQCTIGDFYIILKNNDMIYILSSTATPGLFYTIKNHKICISDNEKQIYSYSSLDNLDEYEIFNFVSSEHNRSPFNNLFKDVKRIPGGSLCKIQHSLQINHRLYIKKSIEQIINRLQKKTTKSYEEFQTAIEQTAKVIAENSDDKDIYIMLSGGIDSLTWLLAFLKTDLNVHILHYDSGSVYEGNIVKILSEKLGFEYDVLNPWFLDIDSDIKRIESMYQSMHIGTIIHNPYILLNKYIKNGTNKPKLIISGENTDASYMIHCFGSSVNVGISFYRAHIKYASKNFCYTEHFFRIINKIKFIIHLYVGQKIQHPYYDYLLSVSHSRFGFTIPFKFFKKDYYFTDENQKNIYLDIKENTVLNVLLDNEDLRIVKDGSIRRNINYFNHLVRLLNFLIYNQSVSLTFCNYGRYFKINHTMPVNFGLLNDYFIDFRLNSLKDAFLPKSYHHRYCNENLNESYRRIAKQAASISGYSLSDGILRFLSRITIRTIVFMRLTGIGRFIKYRVLKKKIPTDNRQEFLLILESLWKEHQLKEFDLMSKIQNQHIKDYLNSTISSLLMKESQDLSAKEVVEIEHLVNLKVYLNSINFQNNLTSTKQVESRPIK